MQFHYSFIAVSVQWRFNVISPWPRAAGEARSSEAIYSGFSLDDTVRRFPFIAKTASCFLRLAICPGDVLDGCMWQVFGLISVYGNLLVLDTILT